MVDISGYINSAIDQVFGQNSVKYNIAKSLQSQYGDDTKKLIDNLSSLCNCDFSSLANLRNVAPSQAVNDAISAAITNAGGQAPSDILIKKRIQDLEDDMGSIAFHANNPQTVGGIIGTADITSISTGTDTITAIMGNVALTTTAQTLSGGIVELDTEMGSATLTTTAQTAKGAINELDAEMGSATLTTTAQTAKGAINEIYSNLGSTSVQVGTLRSFYECSSISDTAPTLIATGASTVSGRSRNDQLCNNWSYSKEWAVIGASKILSDSSSTHVYVSTNSSGNCYDAVGSLMTQSTRASYNTWGDTVSYQASLNPLKIYFNGTHYKTESTSLFITYYYWTLLPELVVSCASSTCSTNKVDISLIIYDYDIPTQIVLCSSFPCTVPSASPFPIRTITNSSGVYTTDPKIFQAYSPYVYLPSETVTCSGSTCTVPNAALTYISLELPERSTTCTAGSTPTCTSLASRTVIDSMGSTVTVPTITITCSPSKKTCLTNVQTISVSHPYGNYLYTIPKQFVDCTSTSCTINKLIAYSTTSSDVIFVPSLTVGATAATSGSLYALCMYELDH